MARVPATVETKLATALDKVNNLLDQSPDSRCNVANSHKEAIRLYVQTWILPELEEIVEWARGERNVNGDQLDPIRDLR